MKLDEIRRIFRATIRDLELIAEAVSNADSDSNATTFPFGGGQGVFLGHGLYVNRSIGAGLDRPVSPAELDEFEQRSIELGHRPAIDASPQTDSSLVGLLIERGYEPGDSNTTMVRDLATLRSQNNSFRIDVVTADTLEHWCAATASGWGHASAEARANSDRYAKAAFIAQSPGLLLAHDSEDNRVVGCGALAIVDGVALLGGMSVLPAERGRGVQSAMIAHRLNLAAQLGADLAVTGAATGSRSERNLRRAGFEPVFEVVTYTLADFAHTMSP